MKRKIFINLSQKKRVVVLVGMLILIVFAVSLFLWQQSASRSLVRAEQVARQILPQTATLQTSEKMPDQYLFVFFDESNDERFEIRVDRKDPTRLTLQSQAEARQQNGTPMKTRSDMIDLIKHIYPDAEITAIQLQEAPSEKRYEMMLEAEHYRGQIEVNPETGQILSRQLRYSQPLLIVSLDDQRASDPKAIVVSPRQDFHLSLSEAKLLLLEALPEAQVEQLQYDEYNSQVIIKAHLLYDGREYDVRVNAQTGEILNQSELQTLYDNRAGNVGENQSEKETEPGLSSGTDQTDDETDDMGDTRNTQAETSAGGTDSDTVPDHTTVATDESDKPVPSDKPAQETTKPVATQEPAPTAAPTTAPTTAPTAAPTTAAAPVMIGKEGAEAVVQKKLPGAVVAAIELDSDDGRFYYEGEAIKDGQLYDFEVDAYTGVILSWDHEGPTSLTGETDTISLSQVRQIVQDRVPGAVIEEIELENDDGQLIYEVDAEKDGMEYAFEIDAYSGKILSLDVDD